MAITLIANTGAGSTDTSVVTTSGIDTTGANFIAIVNSQLYASDTHNISDSKGNTWTKLTTRVGTGVETAIFYCFSPTVGSGHTFTSTTSACFPTICVAAFSGVATSPFDVENGNNAGSGTTTQPGSITPTQNNELVITGLCYYLGSTVSIDSSYSIANTVNYLASNHFGASLAYIVQTSAAATNPTWTFGTSVTVVISAIASFKASAAAANTDPPFGVAQQIPQHYRVSIVNQ